MNDYIRRLIRSFVYKYIYQLIAGEVTENDVVEFMSNAFDKSRSKFATGESKIKAVTYLLEMIEKFNDGGYISQWDKKLFLRALESESPDSIEDGFQPPNLYLETPDISGERVYWDFNSLVMELESSFPNFSSSFLGSDYGSVTDMLSDIGSIRSKIYGMVKRGLITSNTAIIFTIDESSGYIEMYIE